MLGMRLSAFSAASITAAIASVSFSLSKITEALLLSSLAEIFSVSF